MHIKKKIETLYCFGKYIFRKLKYYSIRLLQIFNKSKHIAKNLSLFNFFSKLLLIWYDIFRRPTGSEQKVPAIGVAEEIRSTNPDHIGGYQIALPIFTGIETKFGLCLPRFQAVEKIRK